MPGDPITREDISANYELLRSHIRRTPVLEVQAEDFGLGTATTVRRLVAHYSGGGATRLRDVAVDRLVTISR